MEALEFAALVAAVALGVVHLLAGKLRFLDRIPRSRWLSFAGGISVAYVFVHLLPELEEGQGAVEEAVGQPLGTIEHHVWLLALAGLGLFYGLERAAVASRERRRREAAEDVTEPWAFWLSTVSFAVYNTLIGYLLVHREAPGGARLGAFTFAMGVHFVVNDYGLRHHHRDAYTSVGRWVLAAALLAGWGVGVVVEVSDAALALPIAFLGGGIILNVLKEELPSERNSRFPPFAAGAVAYAALLVAV